jgi:hypothetical protein
LAIVHLTFPAFAGFLYLAAAAARVKSVIELVEARAQVRETLP